MNKAMHCTETELFESIEEFVYQNCKKDTLNFDEYEDRYGINLRKYIDIKGIKKCIDLLNLTNVDALGTELLINEED